LARNRNAFQCENCGVRLGKWAGQCPDCKGWNCIVEIVAEGPSRARFSGYSGQLSSEIKDLSSLGDESVERLPVGVGEIDRVLGGGIVPGSVILLGGDPGPPIDEESEYDRLYVVTIGPDGTVVTVPLRY